MGCVIVMINCDERLVRELSSYMQWTQIQDLCDFSEGERVITSSSSAISDREPPPMSLVDPGSPPTPYTWSPRSWGPNDWATLFNLFLSLSQFFGLLLLALLKRRLRKIRPNPRTDNSEATGGLLLPLRQTTSRARHVLEADLLTGTTGTGPGGVV